MSTARHARNYLLSKSEDLIDIWLSTIRLAVDPLENIEAEAPDPQMIRALTEAVKLVVPTGNMSIDYDITELTQMELAEIFPTGEITPAAIKGGELLKGLLTGKLTPEMARNVLETCDYLFSWEEEFLLGARIDEIARGKNLPALEYKG